MRCVFSTAFRLSSALGPAPTAVLLRHVHRRRPLIGCPPPPITISKLGQRRAPHAHACSAERQECEENIPYMHYVFKNAINAAMCFLELLLYTTCGERRRVRPAPQRWLHNSHLTHFMHGRGLLGGILKTETKLKATTEEMRERAAMYEPGDSPRVHLQTPSWQCGVALVFQVMNHLKPAHSTKPYQGSLVSRIVAARDWHARARTHTLQIYGFWLSLQMLWEKNTCGWG